MAPRLASLRFPFSVAIAWLALAPLGCQSDAGGDEKDDDDEAASARAEPATRVPERNAVAEAPARDEDPGPPPAAEPEPAAAETAAPVAPALTFAACTSAGGPYSDCETIYVTAVQQSPSRCIQLTIDNCGTYGRQGLAADTPFSWRLASASLGAATSPCELGVFYPGNPSIAGATGSVTWNEDTPRPTDLSFDLILQPFDASSDPIPLATTQPLQPEECEE